MKITWLGHSCFTVKSQGYKIVLDPYKDGSIPGLAPVREEADQVLCSHGHGDHCGTECVSLRQGGPSPFTVETIDAVQAKRLADEFSPAVTVPMHYRQAGVGYIVIGTVKRFTKLCDNAVTYSGSELELTPQTSRQTAVLRPQNA